jgi:hypothetical protein
MSLSPFSHPNPAKGTNRPGGVWTAERVEQARNLIEVEGYCSGKAAAIMGISRNSLMGKAHRIGIKLNKQPAMVAQARARTKRAPRPANTVCRPKLSGRVGMKPKIAIIERAPAPPGPTAPLMIPIVKLEADTCRWPFLIEGKTAYCGLRTSIRKFAAVGRLRNPYCDHHSSIAYAPERPRAVCNA